MQKNRQKIDSPNSDKLTWLPSQIFTTFPKDVTGLKFCTLDCGCIYYQRVYPDGRLDPRRIGIYRDAENGACEICMAWEGSWKESVVDEKMVSTENEKKHRSDRKQNRRT